MDIGLIVHTLILNEENKVLIIKRASQRKVFPSNWDIPGGTLEPGEDPAEGALREIKEETSLELDEISLYDYTHNIDTEKNKQFIRLIFIGTYEGGEVQVNPEEHEEYAWVDIDNMKEYDLVYYLPKLIEQL